MPLEVCVDSVESARAAACGGASRVEICGELSVGGLTPTPGLLVGILSVLPPNVSHRVMLRPRGGDFCYDKDEMDIILHDIRILMEHGAKAFVFGALTRDGSLCADSCHRVLCAIRPFPVTLNRAIDVSADWRRTLAAAVEIGFDTVLTSGTKPTAKEGAETLREMVEYAAGNITIMAGSGVSPSSIPLLPSSLEWFHGSASVPISSPSSIPLGPFEVQKKQTSEQLVREMVEIIKKRHNS